MTLCMPFQVRQASCYVCCKGASEARLQHEAPQCHALAAPGPSPSCTLRRPASPQVAVEAHTAGQAAAKAELAERARDVARAHARAVSLHSAEMAAQRTLLAEAQVMRGLGVRAAPPQLQRC